MKIALMRCLFMCLLFKLSLIGKAPADQYLSLATLLDNSWWVYLVYSTFAITSFCIYILHQKRQSNLRYQIDLANMKVKRRLIENKNAFLNHSNYLGTYPVQDKHVEMDLIALNAGCFKVSGHYKEFLDRCIAITERHLDNSDFNVKMLADELATCPSALYKKVKLISGRSTNEFIRYIRLRKAAQLLVTGKYNVNETAMLCGFIDLRYFREQFIKLFGIRPSDYMKKHRINLSDSHRHSLLANLFNND